MTGAATPAAPALRRKLRRLSACEARNCASVTGAAAGRCGAVRAPGMLEDLLGMGPARLAWAHYRQRALRCALGLQPERVCVPSDSRAGRHWHGGCFRMPPWLDRSGMERFHL